MLRVAVPSKGSLSEPAAAMLHEAGYRQRKVSKELVLVGTDNHVEFFHPPPPGHRSLRRLRPAGSRNHRP
jgi:ATP phosphoribosyltransferase